MIYITGDTHGNVDYEKLLKLKEKHVTREDYLIICGDAGICWSEQSFWHFVKMYNDIGCTIIYVDGNHENFALLEELPVVERFGAKMHELDQYIYHVFRGEIMTIEGKTFLCLGGAESIDRMYRVEGLSWWKEENITDEDIENAFRNLKKLDFKVDYVITHCVDTKTVRKAFGFRTDVNTDLLNLIERFVDYKHWYFGHYHLDQDVSKKKTCLYNKIIKIG